MRERHPADVDGSRPVSGFRLWWAEGSRLKSLYGTIAGGAEEWEPRGLKHMRCGMKRPFDGSLGLEAHYAAHLCGVHAFYRAEDALLYGCGLLGMDAGAGRLVMGAVAGHAGTALGRHGFRAAAMSVTALLAPSASAAEAARLLRDRKAPPGKREASPARFLPAGDEGDARLLAMAYEVPLCASLGALRAAAGSAGTLVRPMPYRAGKGGVSRLFAGASEEARRRFESILR